MKPVCWRSLLTRFAGSNRTSPISLPGVFPREMQLIPACDWLWLALQADSGRGGVVTPSGMQKTPPAEPGFRRRGLLLVVLAALAVLATAGNNEAAPDAHGGKADE